MTAFCTKCGSALSTTTRYCTNCGTENLIDTNQDMTPAGVAAVEPAGAAVPSWRRLAQPLSAQLR
jgi:hypothetical protein